MRRNTDRFLEIIPCMVYLSQLTKYNKGVRLILRNHEEFMNSVPLFLPSIGSLYLIVLLLQTVC